MQRSSRYERPIVKLRPKRGGRFFAGAPWIYKDEIAFDRRTKMLAPGAIATLVDKDQQTVAAIAFNAASGIAARVLDRNPAVEIDAHWIEQKLRAALSIRKRLYKDPFYRLCHAEGDGLPGLVIDRYGDAVVVQPNAAWTEARRTQILAAIDVVLAPKTIVWNGSSRGRALEGLDETIRVMKGAAVQPVITPMNGAVYLADIVGGQKTGCYFDQRDTHAFVAALAQGRRLLDVFCHIGGFSLAALAAGADQAVAIDGSESALAAAIKAAESMGVAEKIEARRGDAFDLMRAAVNAGERFDIVVCDPPAFAPSRQARQSGLRAYEKTARLGVSLTAQGGVFAFCSCSQSVSQADLEEIAQYVLRKARRSGRLLRAGGAGADHPVHPALPETRYLKTLVYRLD